MMKLDEAMRIMEIFVADKIIELRGKGFKADEDQLHEAWRRVRRLVNKVRGAVED